MTIATLDEKQFKILLKEAIVELFEERQEVFSAIVAEAIEDIGLANAIREGQRNLRQADMSTLEGEIDQLAYQLYGLTREEVAIVEGRS
ncbi:MAG: hypothetical protein QMD04_11680 [Anaerolineales bacterium]|nr:hypothetical protein [Anaerolineales bacterium]